LNIFQEELVVKDFMIRLGSEIRIPLRPGGYSVSPKASSPEVVDQRLSDPGGSGNRMISDMQVINFLTRAGVGLPGGGKS
jgi:hypothetical protein